MSGATGATTVGFGLLNSCAMRVRMFMCLFCLCLLRRNLVATVPQENAMCATVWTWFAQLLDAEVDPVAIVLDVFSYELDERRNVHIDLDVAVGWMLECFGFRQEC